MQEAQQTIAADDAELVTGIDARRLNEKVIRKALALFHIEVGDIAESNDYILLHAKKQDKGENQFELGVIAGNAPDLGRIQDHQHNLFYNLERDKEVGQSFIRLSPQQLAAALNQMASNVDTAKGKLPTDKKSALYELTQLSNGLGTQLDDEIAK